MDRKHLKNVVFQLIGISETSERSFNLDPSCSDEKKVFSGRLMSRSGFSVVRC